MNSVLEIHAHHLVITAENATAEAALYCIYFFVPRADGQEPEIHMVKAVANKPWDAIAKVRKSLPSQCYGWRIGSIGSAADLPKASKGARHAAIAAQQAKPKEDRVISPRARFQLAMSM